MDYHFGRLLRETFFSGREPPKLRKQMLAPHGIGCPIPRKEIQGDRLTELDIVED